MPARAPRKPAVLSFLQKAHSSPPEGSLQPGPQRTGTFHRELWFLH